DGGDDRPQEGAQFFRNARDRVPDRRRAELGMIPVRARYAAGRMATGRARCPARLPVPFEMTRAQRGSYQMAVPYSLAQTVVLLPVRGQWLAPMNSPDARRHHIGGRAGLCSGTPEPKEQNH